MIVCVCVYLCVVVTCAVAHEGALSRGGTCMRRSYIPRACAQLAHELVVLGVFSKPLLEQVEGRVL